MLKAARMPAVEGGSKRTCSRGGGSKRTCSRGGGSKRTYSKQEGVRAVWLLHVCFRLGGIRALGTELSDRDGAALEAQTCAAIDLAGDGCGADCERTQLRA
jgi:hypothetical protein